MKLYHLTRVLAVAAVLTFLVVGLCPAQDPAQMDPKMAEMMKKWEEIATPGVPHKLLDQFVGNWDVKSKWWMEGPDRPPMETKGSAEIKWVLGGRFIEERFSGEMMGKPFEGIGCTGYDNFNQQYQFSWMDNTNTAIFMGEGSYDPKEKKLIYPVKMDDCTTGEKDKPGLFVCRLISSDKHIMEMYDGHNADPKMKTAEMIYTKK